MIVRLFAGAALACALIATAAQAAPTPRETATRVAKAIEDNYFDPARGKTIADGLRAAAAKGEFDALTDPRDLARTLSDRLEPLDHHFNVAWNPTAAAPAGGPPPAPRLSFEDQIKRGNYGFRRVDLLPGAIGYIEMTGHADFAFGNPDDPARKAVDAALQLVSGADAVIIDLRDNGGGSPAMVGYLVSAFTPKGADIYNVFHSREGTESEAPTDYYAAPRTDVPLYILTSGRTGSAAEATAYTLQAAKRAIIVGETSAGAANPGGPVPVGDGFSIFVSQGTPVNAVTKGNWEGTGVKPDVAVPAAEALTRARMLALEAVLARAPNAPTATDTRWVLEALKAEVSPPAGLGGLPEFEGAYGDVTVTRAGSTLSLQRGRRPPLVLAALGDGAFYVVGDPSRRVVFERGPDGKVSGLEIRSSSGQSSRFRR
jgi:hypothetical protein